VSDTDDRVTDALAFGFRLIDAWFGAFRTMAISTAEVVNPDDVVIGDNACQARAKPTRASAVSCGPLVNNATGRQLPPHLVSISPAGVGGPAQVLAADGTIAMQPQLQELLVWVADPGNLPVGCSGMFEGDLLDDANTPIAKVKMHVSPSAGPNS
jgi:hypothetical protein